MCGIFGVSGSTPAVPLIAAGLKKLEYRGYDSSGIAVNGEKGIWLCKSAGSLSRLEKKLKQSAPPLSSVGIGHTRWATHGKATDLNAHPFLSADGMFAVAHNGIIENYTGLKAFLSEKGFSLVSDTDSEVVPMLLEYFYDGDVLKAIRRAVSELEGAFSLAIITSRAPDCAKRLLTCNRLRQRLFVCIFGHSRPFGLCRAMLHPRRKQRRCAAQRRNQAVRPTGQQNRTELQTDGRMRRRRGKRRLPVFYAKRNIQSAPLSNRRGGSVYRRKTAEKNFVFG